MTCGPSLVLAGCVFRRLSHTDWVLCALGTPSKGRHALFVESSGLIGSGLGRKGRRREP